MIIYDPDNINLLVSYAQKANESVEGAVNLLQKVSVHTDWCCNEKNQINEFCIKNKTHIKRLKERTDSYLFAVNAVNHSSKILHNNLIKDIFKINSHISEIANVWKSDSTIKCPPGNSNSWVRIGKILDSIPTAVTMLERTEASSLQNAISVVEFPNLNN